MYYTYILENSRGMLYIGQTNNIPERVFRHNSNQEKATKNKGPWRLLFQKEFLTRAESVRFEKYLKSLKRPEFIKKYIIGS